jgi:hypothetical protein
MPFVLQITRNQASLDACKAVGPFHRELWNSRLPGFKERTRPGSLEKPEARTAIERRQRKRIACTTRRAAWLHGLQDHGVYRDSQSSNAENRIPSLAKHAVPA